MKTIPKGLQKVPEPIASMAAEMLAKNEKEVYSEKEINDWMGLSNSERALLIGIRKHMRERTSLKGSKGWTSARVVDIAKYSGFEKRQAGRLIKSLEDKKVLTIIGKDKRGPLSRRGYAIQKQACCFSAT